MYIEHWMIVALTVVRYFMTFRLEHGNGAVCLHESRFGRGLTVYTEITYYQILPSKRDLPPLPNLPVHPLH